MKVNCYQMEDKNFVEVKNVHICLFENKHLLVWKQPFACSKTYTGEEISS